MTVSGGAGPNNSSETAGAVVDPYWWLVQASIEQDSGLPELSTEEFTLVLGYLRAAVGYPR